MNYYRVKFLADHFILTTAVGIEVDTEVADSVIIDRANDLIMREHAFSPIKHAFDIEIEDLGVLV